MKIPIRIIAAAIVLCMALISVSCSSDGYGTSTVYVGVGYGGYGGYGPGWGHGWGGYGGYYPPPVVIGPPPIPDIPDFPVAEPF